MGGQTKRLGKSIEKNPVAAKAKGKKGQKGQKTASVVPAHEKPNVKENIEDKPNFVGSTNNPKVKGLPTHEGPKVRHNKRDKEKPGKAGISRKDLKKSEQERKDPKLRRKRQKRRAEENAKA